MSIGIGHVVTDSIVLNVAALVEYGASLAIVIDDIGYRPVEETGELLALPFPLTLAVFPERAVSATVIRRARRVGKDVIMHLPMEPEGGAEVLEPNTLLVSMEDDVLRGILRHQLSSLSGIIGVNNHMGSRATQSERVMRIVMEEIRPRGIFFLDSYTSPHSLAERTARACGIRAAGRDIFIDNVADVSQIEAELRTAAEIARRSGRAIAIGHDRRETLIALRNVVPQIQKTGVRICLVREFVR
jgi:hypothetical protein